MSSWRQLQRQFRALFDRSRLDSEMNKEMRSHIEMQTAENLAAGMPPEKARDAAIRKFGHCEGVKAECREQREGFVVRHLSIAAGDVRIAARMLRRNPGFALAVISTLGLALGATTVIYSFVHAILVRPLPYEAPDRIAQLWSNTREQPSATRSVALPNFVDWKQQTRAFSRLACYQANVYNYSGQAEATQVASCRVSSGFFEVFGVRPHLGRGILPEDDAPEAERIVVASHEFWLRELGGADALGRNLFLEGTNYTLVGVMPAGFRFPRQTDVWIPIAAPARQLEAGYRAALTYHAVGRLRSGVTMQQAQAEMDAIALRLESDYPEENTDRGILLAGLHNNLVRDIRPSLLMLFGAVGIVLLIACANVASLLLARAAARRREMAIRVAMGAGRWRIVRQLLTESLLLGIGGGAAGMLLAWWSLELARQWAPGNLPRLNEVTLDLPVLGFVFLTSSATGILFGILPAWEAFKGSAAGWFRTRGTSQSSSSATRNILVVSEVGLAVVLLVGAGLLARSLLALESVPPGLNPHQIVCAELHLPSIQYGGQRVSLFYRDVQDQMAKHVGAENVALARYVPFSPQKMWWGFSIEGKPPPPAGRRPMALYNASSGNYFLMTGIPLLRGRTFEEQDIRGNPGVVIINKAFANRWFGGEDPIGQRLDLPGHRDNPYTIIGMVANAHQHSLSEPPEPELFLSQMQSWSGSAAVLVRTPGNPAGAARLLREIIKKADATVPVANVKTLDSLIGASASEPRFRTRLLGSLAALALGLAAVGIYGVLAYTVTQRTREIGIRIALGARRGQVLRLIISQGMRPVLAGVALGTAGAFALTRLMTHLLFEIKPGDPVSFLCVTLLMLTVALCACWLPACRAAQADPISALRRE